MKEIFLKQSQIISHSELCYFCTFVLNLASVWLCYFKTELFYIELLPSSSDIHLGPVYNEQFDAQKDGRRSRLTLLSMRGY